MPCECGVVECKQAVRVISAGLFLSFFTSMYFISKSVVLWMDGRMGRYYVPYRAFGERSKMLCDESKYQTRFSHARISQQNDLNERFFTYANVMCIVVVSV